MKKILYTIVIFAVLASCKKNAAPKPDNPYGLPNATQTGAGVFACRINGVNAITKSYDIYDMSGGIIDDTIALKGTCPYGSSFYESIYLGIVNSTKLNVAYDLSDTSNSYCYFITDSTCQFEGTSPITFKLHKGSITLTKLDTINKIISGMFAFDVPIPNCDTLHITDGRFDYGY